MKFEIDVDQVTDFFREHGPLKVRVWTRDYLYSYLNHHHFARQLAVIFQPNGAIVGAGTARMVNRRKPAHFKDTWRVSEDGNTILMDQAAILHSAVMPRLLDQMVKRFGPRRWVAGYRYDKLRLWEFDRYISLSNRIFSRMNRLSQHREFKKEPVRLKIDDIEVNEELMQFNSNEAPSVTLGPILVGRINGRAKPYLLIDGHHRLNEAKSRGESEIDAEAVNVPDYLKPTSRTAVIKLLDMSHAN